MEPLLVTLCYHRVLPASQREGEGRPYFLRGTAITEGAFDAQLRRLAERFEVLDASRALAWLRGARTSARPACWVTFDDGYRDVLRYAAPRVSAHTLRATVFVTTRTLEDPSFWLPADRWYATLSRARRPIAQPLQGATARAYERLVDGPERRRFLRATRPVQDAMVASLAAALDAPSLPRPEIYLSADELHALSREGWSIGGHGHEHAILDNDDNVKNELERPAHVLRSLGFKPEVFAWADGASCHDARVEARRVGWSAALALGNAPVVPSSDPYSAPRFVPSDDPDWVDRVLLPSLATRIPHAPLPSL